MKDATYKWYLLGLLLLIQAFSFVDRLALGLLTQNIKVDLSLSDSELALLGGIAFALFYATMGIPIARWADRGNRAMIMAATTALWSVAVALCGTARNFVQLVLNRVAVGVGEAGCMPITNSLIPDYFGRTERTRAMTIIALSSPLAVMFGYGAAGWIAQYYGWRTTFMCLGLPGVPLAVLAALTLREPRKSWAGAESQGQPVPSVSLWETCMTLWRVASFRHMAISYVVGMFFNTGIAQWVPAFFVRSYGMHTGELGTWLAATTGVGGFLGTYAGGELASRFAGNSEPLQLKVMAAVFAVAAFLQASIFVVPNYHAAFGILAAAIVLGMAVNGPMFAIKQTIVPKHMLATSFALLFMLGNLIGMGVGPLAVGVVSDLLHPLLGKESLRYALLILTPGYLWSAWHMWVARKTVLHDARVVEHDSAHAGALEQVAAASAHPY